MDSKNAPGTPSSHLPGLDVLRAVAILLVFGYHATIFFRHPPELRQWLAFGWTGVDLFFVLSGYLITSQLLAARARGGVDLGAYFVKRAFRILPAYWLMVAVYFLLPGWGEAQGHAPLWKFLSFTQNLGLDLSHQRAFSHAWSLCIEEQFYLALPLLLLCVRGEIRLRRVLGMVGGLMLAGVLLRQGAWSLFVEPGMISQGDGSLRPGKEWSTWIYYPTQGRLDGLLTGALIAGIFQTRPEARVWTDRRPLLFLGLSALLLVLGWHLGTPMNSHACALLGYPVISYAYGALLICALSPGFVVPAPVYQPLKWIAVLSYGVYLSHKVAGHLLQSWLTALGLEPEGWPMFAALLVGCFLVGLALHLAVERPAFWLRDRILARRKTNRPPLSSCRSPHTAYSSSAR